MGTHQAGAIGTECEQAQGLNGAFRLIMHSSGRFKFAFILTTRGWRGRSTSKYRKGGVARAKKRPPAGKAPEEAFKLRACRGQ